MIDDLARAAALLDLNRPEEAEARLRAVLAATPESAEALRLLALTLSLLQRPGEAVRAAEAAVRLEPEEVAGYAVLSDAHVEAHQPGPAVAAAEQAVRLAPHLGGSYAVRARALLCGNRPRARDALDDALRAVQLAPDEAQYHNLIGVCYRFLRDQRQAELAFRNALAIDPQYTDAKSNLAAMHVDSGRLRTAAAGITSALTEDPQHQTLRQNLDLVVVKICYRLLMGTLLGAALTGVALLQQAPALLRAGVGVLTFAAVVGLARWLGRQLPRGISWWGRGLIGRIGWHGRRIMLLLVATQLALLLLAFAPPGPAIAAGLALLWLLRIVGLLVLIWLVVGAVWALVRGNRG